MSVRLVHIKQVRRLIDSAILLGCGGHAKSLMSLFQSKQSSIRTIGYSCSEPSKARAFNGLEFISVGELASQQENQYLLNGIGLSVSARDRRAIFDGLMVRGFSRLSIIADSATIDNSSTLGSGLQIFHGAIVQADSSIGDDVVLGSGSIIEHDSVIGLGSFVCPGALIMGGVFIGEEVTVYSGAIILPGVKIGQGAVIGAGAVVLKDVAPGETYVGNPGRSLGARDAK
jgi:sugar O-acyltransferase (sialic acid O-acetyltransferase NeuD family)